MKCRQPMQLSPFVFVSYKTHYLPVSFFFPRQNIHTGLARQESLYMTKPIAVYRQVNTPLPLKPKSVELKAKKRRKNEKCHDSSKLTRTGTHGSKHQSCLFVIHQTATSLLATRP